MKPFATRRTGLVLLGAAILITLVSLVVPRVGRQITLSVDQAGLVDAHGLEWSVDSWTVKSGRDDPHFELVLPRWARPVTELTLIVEPIWGNVGTFDFFHLPVDGTGEFFSEKRRVAVDAKIYGGPYPLKVVFPQPSDRIRIDPPDGAQFILKSVIVRAFPGAQPIVTGTLWWLVLGLWGATLLAFFWKQCGDAIRWFGAKPRWVVLVMLAVVVLVRLWLTATQPLKAVGGAIHDDQHFIDQAASIAEGHWLGAYDHLTLIKGQGYSLWIAAMFFLGIPLVFSQHLIYVGAATLAYAAWRPVMTRFARFSVVAVVLFNPASYHGDDAARVLRNHFCASLALLTFVCVTGWFLRLRQPIRAQLGWAAGTGLAFCALWLTREETVWMSGVIGLVALAGAWLTRKDGRAVWLRVAQVALVPGLILVAGVTTICALNYSYYRFWGTVEFRASAYKDAYGALARINVGPWRQFVPVSREAREAAYVVSPTFARLQPFLEGELGEGWASLGEWQTGLPPRERQIHGAAFMWALRDGAAAAGEHLNCERAMGFYRRMADEINAACASGRLPSLRPRSGFVPPWRSEYASQLPGAYFRAWKFITTFAYVVPKPPPSTGWDDSLAVYRTMTRTTLSPREEDPPLPPSQRHLEAFKNGVMKDVTRIYAFATPLAVIVALPLLLWLWLRVRRGAARYETAVLATTALAGAVAITLVVTLVEVTSFVAITIGYQAAAYPLMLLFVALTVAALIHSFAASRDPQAY